MFRMGFPELVLIIAIVALLIGSFKLPKNAKGARIPVGDLQKGFDNNKQKAADKKASQSDFD